MALVQKLPSLSSPTHLRKPNSSYVHPICCSINYTSSSPFTEKHSIERYPRDQWISCSNKGEAFNRTLPKRPMDFLQQQGIHVQVIPGITAASGIAAELGIPHTHKGIANSVRFLTGHSRKGGNDPLFVVESAADSDSTLVVYKGLSTLPPLAHKLMAFGLPPDTPAAAVERGTTPQQRTIFFGMEGSNNRSDFKLGVNLTAAPPFGASTFPTIFFFSELIRSEMIKETQSN